MDHQTDFLSNIKPEQRVIFQEARESAREVYRLIEQWHGPFETELGVDELDALTSIIGMRQLKASAKSETD